MKKGFEHISEQCRSLTLGLKDAQDLIKGKWKVMILQALFFGEKMTFGEIRRYVPGISPKMLTQELRDLEQNVLVNRQIIESENTTIFYSLTDYGKSISEIIQSMAKWGNNYRNDIYKTGTKLEK